MPEYYYLKKLNPNVNKLFFTSSKYKKYFTWTYSSSDPETTVINKFVDVLNKKDMIKHNYILFSILDILNNKTNQEFELKKDSNSNIDYYENSDMIVYFELKFNKFRDIEKLYQLNEAEKELDIILKFKNAENNSNQYLIVEVFGGSNKDIKNKKKAKYQDILDDLKKNSIQSHYILFTVDSYSSFELTRDYDYEDYKRQLFLYDMEMEYWQSCIDANRVIKTIKKKKNFLQRIMKKTENLFAAIFVFSVFAFYPIMTFLLFLFIIIKHKYVKDLIYYACCYFLLYFVDNQKCSDYVNDNYDRIFG